MLAIALDLLLVMLCAVAPGLAVAKVSLPRANRLELVTVGLIIGLFVVPLLHFTVAIALGTHVSRPLLGADAAVILAVCAAVGWWRR